MCLAINLLVSLDHVPPPPNSGSLQHPARGVSGVDTCGGHEPRLLASGRTSGPANLH